MTSATFVEHAHLIYVKNYHHGCSLQQHQHSGSLMDGAFSISNPSWHVNTFQERNYVYV